jgi:hypothetical protein
MSPTPRWPGADPQFRRLHEDDLSALLALQEANLHDNLTPAQRSHGFLSARFRADQFAEMNRGGAVIVAHIPAGIGGYLCGSTVEFNRAFPLLATMIEAYPGVQFRGRALDGWTSFVYGPVCIGAHARGQGLLRGMYLALLQEMRGRFDVGVAFVSESNPHSLSAHIQGLGMSDAGGFEFAQRRYRILAFSTQD